MIACVRTVEGPDKSLATVDALVARLSAFSGRVEPIVEADFVGGYVDLGPLSDGDAARELGITIGRTVREGCRVTPTVGLAAGKYPAFVAARLASHNRLIVVPAGQEATFLAPKAIEHLPFDQEALRRLHRLGIHTLGQFAALPAGAVLQQFGRHGQLLHRLAQGQDHRSVGRYAPAELICDSHQFNDPVMDATVLDRVLGRLAGTCGAELNARNTAARHLRLLLETDSHTRHIQQRGFREGIMTAERLHRGLRQLLDRTVDRGLSGVVAVEVRLSDLEPVRGQQLDLFGRPTADTSWLEDALPALVARHGADNFYTVVTRSDAMTVPERRYRFRIREGDQ